MHYAGVPVPPVLAEADVASIVSDALFGADHAPRFIILVGLHEWLLLDRFKWPNSRALRFDWSEILDRKDPLTLQAAAALLHRDSLAPEQRRQSARKPGRERPQACVRGERGSEIRHP